jgi:hypothetical protein
VSSPPDPASALRDQLASRGLRVHVEGAGTLAILVPAEGDALDWAAVRHEIVCAARLHGFSHVAVELPPAGEAGDADDAVRGPE